MDMNEYKRISYDSIYIVKNIQQKHEYYTIPIITGHLQLIRCLPIFHDQDMACQYYRLQLGIFHVHCTQLAREMLVNWMLNTLFLDREV